MVHFAVPASVLELLQDAHFPCAVDELLVYAEEKGAPEEFLTLLRTMEGHIFQSLDDLALSWGFIHEFQIAEEAGIAAPAPPEGDMLAPTEIPAPRADSSPAASE